MIDNHSISMFEVYFSWSYLHLMRFRVGRGHVNKYWKCPGCYRNLQPCYLVLIQAHNSHVTCLRLSFANHKMGIVVSTTKVQTMYHQPPAETLLQENFVAIFSVTGADKNKKLSNMFMRSVRWGILRRIFLCI